MLLKDLMSDREWLRQIDEGWDGSEDDGGEEIELAPKKKGKGGRRPAGAREGETPIGGGNSAEQPAKRERKRKKAMDEEVGEKIKIKKYKLVKKSKSGAGSGDEEKSGSGTPAGRRGGGKKARTGAKVPPSNPELTEKLNACLSTLLNYKDRFWVVIWWDQPILVPFKITHPGLNQFE